VALHNFIRDTAEHDVDFATSMPEVEVQVHGNQGTTGDGSLSAEELIWVPFVVQLPRLYVGDYLL
jgi:hypothetical protein